jgi:hypothetical protein
MVVGMDFLGFFKSFVGERMVIEDMFRRKVIVVGGSKQVGVSWTDLLYCCGALLYDLLKLIGHALNMSIMVNDGLLIYLSQSDEHTRGSPRIKLGRALSPRSASKLA